MAATFTPKQITQYDASHLSELQGNVSETVTTYLLSLVPPINSGAVVHDNACGSGAVFETIMTSKPAPTGIEIKATDINEQFVAGCKALAEKHNWPVETAVMPAQKLGFGDNIFSHSITNFAFHCLSDQAGAASEIHRTLKPGGTAVATVWSDMPHAFAMLRVHKAMRGDPDGSDTPFMLRDLDYDEAHLRKALTAGGFKDGEVEISHKTAHLEIPDLKRWAQLGWSYLGMPMSGWKQKDEDEWEATIALLEQELQKGHGTTKKEDGTWVLEMIATVGKVTKS